MRVYAITICDFQFLMVQENSLYLQNKQQESSVMEKLHKQQPTVQQKKKLRSKGDRLGWTPLNEVEHKPLSEVVGKPRILTDENMYRLKGVKPIL